MRVKAIMMPFSKLACISVENTVEEAMKIIDEQGLLSLPVVDGQQFVGVLSKQFLFEEFFRNYTGTREEFAQRTVMEFKEYQKIFGNKHNSMAIYTYDIRGVLGKICELIAKEGGDICNMMVIPTDVMDLAEIFLRVEAPDFERVVRALERHGYDVRDVKYNDQK